VEDLDIEQRFHLMQKEIEATVSLLKEAKLDLTASVDSLKIEIEALKTYIERQHPGFSESFAKLKEEAIQAIDPEWLAAGGERRQ
jgi:hypothetical protein